MKILPPMNESAESTALVEGIASATEIHDFCSLPVALPVHVHERVGTPDLGSYAIHLFPDGFDDSTIDIKDPDLGSDHFVLCKGDMTCRSLYTGSWLAVEGVLKAKIIEGCSGCNRGTIADKIDARLIIENGHSFIADFEVDIVYTIHQMIEPGEGISRLSSDPGELFNLQFLTPIEDDESEFDIKRSELVGAILNGENWKLS